MDASADNYDDLATQDTYDTCEYVGCTDSVYLEYYLGGGETALNNITEFTYSQLQQSYILVSPGQIANSLGGFDFGDLCATEIIEGCTISDPLNPMLNFNPDANINDGSCVVQVDGCMDSGYLSAISEFNSPQYMDQSTFTGETDGTVGPYVHNGGAQNDQQIMGNAGTIGYGSFIHWDSATNAGACNYSPAVNYDDGSCMYPYTDDDGINYDCNGNAVEEVVDQILGCTDPAACNYDENANTDDPSNPCYAAENLMSGDGDVISSNPTVNGGNSSPGAFTLAGGFFCANATLASAQCESNWANGNYVESCFVFACSEDECPPDFVAPPEVCWDIEIEQCDPCLPEGVPAPTMTLECVSQNGGEPVFDTAIFYEAQPTIGCMDENALNYMECATEDSGDCEYYEEPEFNFGCAYCPGETEVLYYGTWPAGFQVESWPPPEGSPIIAVGDEVQVSNGFWYPYDDSGVYDFGDYMLDEGWEVATIPGMNWDNCREIANANNPLLQEEWAQFCGDNTLGSYTGAPDPNTYIYTEVPNPNGCTDANAYNYNPDASIDDGTCKFCCDGFGTVGAGASEQTCPGFATSIYYCDDNACYDYLTSLINNAGPGSGCATPGGPYSQ